MKNIFLSLAAALTLVAAATPASAQSRLYAEGTVGSNFKSDNVNYGLAVGAEGGLTRNVNLYAEVGAENFDRDFAVSLTAGLNARVAGPVSLYGEAGGLLNGDDVGYRLGTGLGLNLTEGTQLRAGVQRDSYGTNRNSTTGTLGLRVRF